jgi:hypothetical protein
MGLPHSLVWVSKMFLKSCFFWDITLCSPLKVSRYFGGTFPSSRLKSKPRQPLFTAYFMLISCLALLSTWRWRWHARLKSWLTLIELHSIISQKTELFISTAVRTSNPTVDNVTKVNNCINVPLSQTFRSYIHKIFLFMAIFITNGRLHMRQTDGLLGNGETIRDARISTSWSETSSYTFIISYTSQKQIKLIRMTEIMADCEHSESYSGTHVS